MKRILDFLRNHGTKVLGFAQGTIAAVAGVTGIIPADHLKYWLGASAILTFWRGYTNTLFQPKPEIARDHDGIDSEDA